MTFNRRWDLETRDFIIDRTLTGPPVVPETGTAQGQDGIIVGDNAEPTIAPPMPVRVTMPGPREPLMSADGIMAPRWRRFFEELHRRTGHIRDNVNDTSSNVGDSTTGALAITGYAPTVVVA